MCGILGIVGQPNSHVNQLLYDGLTVLQPAQESLALSFALDASGLQVVLQRRRVDATLIVGERAGLVLQRKLPELRDYEAVLLRAASTVYQDDLKARGGNVTSEQADAARELSAEERAVNTVRCGAVWCWRMA